jgi:FkbM family methyltransferase
MSNFLNKVRNSKIHYWICKLLEKFEMEGFTISYSQNGEDLVIRSYFGKNFRNGTYIDVGCNNPIQKSNTFKFYLKNWSGIAIDGNEALCNKFRKIRKRDTVLNELISDTEYEVEFYLDKTNHEYSTIDKSVGETYKKENLTIVKRKTKTLDTILSTQKVEKIDLLCIDVEGHDFHVLKSLSFSRYSPTMVVIETGDTNTTNIEHTPIYQFLTSRGYSIYTLSKDNCYYVKNN